MVPVMKIMKRDKRKKFTFAAVNLGLGLIKRSLRQSAHGIFLLRPLPNLLSFGVVCLCRFMLWTFRTQQSVKKIEKLFEKPGYVKIPNSLNKTVSKIQ